jgi:hypothetical protein
VKKWIEAFGVVALFGLVVCGLFWIEEKTRPADLPEQPKTCILEGRNEWCEGCRNWHVMPLGPEKHD